jgi:hypothetical protein
MGVHRSKGKKDGRTSKMHDTNRGGLDRHSDNGGSKVASARTPAISGLAGSTRGLLAVVGRVL